MGDNRSKNGTTVIPNSCSFMGWLAIGAITALAWLTPVTAQGKTPRVRFDFPHAVECHDVTPQDSAILHSSEKMIEATFRISTRVDEGREEDLVELIVEINSHSERMSVAEFLPATTLESDLIGEIQIQETKETVGTWGASISAAIPIPYGNLTFHENPLANIGGTGRTTRTETRKTAPPTRVVVSSGTMHNQHGVFFKLRPSRDSALEDVHLFVVRFMVPQQWRGDWVLLTCRAKSIKTGFSFTKAIAGTANVYLGLHLTGDIEAQQAAHRLAHAQVRFLESNEQSIGRQITSVFSRLVEHARDDVSDCLATIGWAKAADSLSTSSSTKQATNELQAARHAMKMLDGVEKR